MAKWTQERKRNFWARILKKRVEMRKGNESPDDGIFYENQSYETEPRFIGKETRLCYLDITKTFKDNSGKTQKLESWNECPTITDLNALRDLALPLLQETHFISLTWDKIERLWRAEIDGDKETDFTTIQGENPALALAEAIEKALGQKDAN